MLNQATQMLLWAGHIHPVSPAADAASAQALNRALWLMSAAGSEYGWVAAPGIGSGLPAGRAAMRAAHALQQNPALRGKALFDATTAGIGKTDPAALAAFERETLPAWRRLGVLGPEK
jgi:hypothetical protein